MGENPTYYYRVSLVLSDNTCQCKVEFLSIRLTTNLNLSHFYLF